MWGVGVQLKFLQCPRAVWGQVCKMGEGVGKAQVGTPQPVPWLSAFIQPISYLPSLFLLLLSLSSLLCLDNVVVWRLEEKAAWKAQGAATWGIRRL